ncbi:MAG: AAA family ATPase [Clostridia bacterium]|nr:AAA family ATPase [Clostridia bacterium]
MGRRILIASGKGGVGKTTISAGLGESLAKLGASVCVIDLDFSFNNLDIVASIENKVVYDLGDYLQGKCRLKQTLIEFKRGLNLYFISSAKVDTDNIDIAKIEEAILKLSQIFDYII